MDKQSPRSHRKGHKHQHASDIRAPSKIRSYDVDRCCLTTTMNETTHGTAMATITPFAALNIVQLLCTPTSKGDLMCKTSAIVYDDTTTHPHIKRILITSICNLASSAQGAFARYTRQGQGKTSIYIYYTLHLWVRSLNINHALQFPFSDL